MLGPLLYRWTHAGPVRPQRQTEQDRYQVLPTSCVLPLSVQPALRLGSGCLCCSSQGGKLWHHWNVWQQQGWVSKEYVCGRAEDGGWGRNSHLWRNLVGARQRHILSLLPCEVGGSSHLFKWRGQDSKRLNNLLKATQLDNGQAGNLRSDSQLMKSGVPNCAHLFIHVTYVNRAPATCQVLL